MFEDLLGQSGKIQEELALKLDSIIIEEKLDGIFISATASKKITSIELSPTLLKEENKEQLEDQLLVALNRLFDKISETEQKESAEFMKNMLPPGFDNLFG
jgi:nucleoid-associated protein EbfC